MPSLPSYSQPESAFPKPGQRSPYAVSVMRAAKDTLLARHGSLFFQQEQSGFGSRSPLPIDTTHDYIALEVTSEEQYLEIADNGVIEFSQQPSWDFEEGKEWHAPPNQEVEVLPSTFFAVVEHGVTIPHGADVLEYVHIPETEEAEAYFDSEPNFVDYIDSIEFTAFDLIDIENPYEVEGLRATRWDASGRIRAANSVYSSTGPVAVIIPEFEAVPGVKIRLTRGYRSASTFASSTGSFRINGIRRSRNWRVVFKDQNTFRVVNSLGIERKFDRGGPTTRTPWDLQLAFWYEAWMNATIAAGCDKYDRARAQHGLASPWKNLSRLNIRSCYDCEGPNRRTGVPIANEIKIVGRRSNGDRRTSSQVQRALAHELTHSAHRRNGEFHLVNVHKIVNESYADFVEYLFCERFYPNQNRNWNGDGQSRRADRTTNAAGVELPTMLNGYTPVFIDLLDNVDQCGTFLPAGSPCDVFPRDNVSGVSPWVIQQTVFRSRNLTDFQNQLSIHFSGQPDLVNIREFVASFYVPLEPLIE